MNWIEVV